MRIVFLGNNRVAWRVLQWLTEGNEDVVGLVLHPEGKRKFGEEMKGCLGVSEEQVFDGSRLRETQVIESIRALKPDIGLSLLFGYFFRRPFIDLFPSGIVNLHPSYLPYNRGGYPNVWSIIDGTPAGVSIHYIDDAIDTGDVIAQREVAVEPVDTGHSLYRKLERESVRLFQEVWPSIRAGQAPRSPQPAGRGTYYRTRDVTKIDHIEMAQSYTAQRLIDILRARTFPPYRGAYFEQDGRKVYMRLQLLYEDELE